MYQFMRFWYLPHKCYEVIHSEEWIKTVPSIVFANIELNNATKFHEDWIKSMPSTDHTTFFSLRFDLEARPRGYKTFFTLNST